MDANKPFLSIPQWGVQFFDPPLGRARAYALAHELGLAIRLGERKLVVSRRAAEELAVPTIERARQVAAAAAAR